MISLLPLLLSVIANLRTLPGAASAVSAVTAGVTVTGGNMPTNAAEWFVLICGAVGVAAQYVTSQVSSKKGSE